MAESAFRALQPKLSAAPCPLPQKNAQTAIRSDARESTSNMASLAVMTLFAVITLTGCGGQVSERPSHSSVPVEGPLDRSDSGYDVKEGDEIHVGTHVNNREVNYQLSIEQVLRNLGSDNIFTVAKGGCLVKRTESHQFVVVSCADAPDEGCLKDEVLGNTVVYEDEEPCPVR